MTGLFLCSTALLLGLKYGSYPLQGVSTNGDSTIGVEQITTLVLMLIHMALCSLFPGQKIGYGKSESKKQVREISLLLVFMEYLWVFLCMEGLNALFHAVLSIIAAKPMLF